MFTIKFTAKDANGKTIRFTIREPVGPNAEKYAYERMIKIANAKGWTSVRFA